MKDSRSEMIRHENETILIIGATIGIGLAAAAQLAAMGLFRL